MFQPYVKDTITIVILEMKTQMLPDVTGSKFSQLQRRF
jgi:hypothetical protein